MRDIINGILGGIVVVAFLIIYLCFSEAFNYKSIYILNANKVCNDSILGKPLNINVINNISSVSDNRDISKANKDSASNTKIDTSRIKNNYIVSVEKDTIKTIIDNSRSAEVAAIIKLKKDGLLLTPNEYTSNIGSYYNTLIAFLSILFVVFSLVSYNSIKVASKKEIEAAVETALKDMLNDSVKFRETILGSLYGRVAENFVDKEDFSSTISALEDTIEDIRKDIIANNPDINQEIE